MAQCVVIADDLTGANATGVLLKKMNYSAYTILNTEGIDTAILQDSDCILYPTDSRGIAPAQAYDRVYKACQAFKSHEVKVYANRIDSTLRGNIGAETDAMLDALGEDYVAIVAPCFPASGRIIIGGYMLVEGIPLHKTNIAIDPKAPVEISEVAKLFAKQSKYGVASIYMGQMMDGYKALASLMKEKVDAGNRILCLDCVTQEDLDLIADAVLESGMKIITVDPGVFTATMARKLIAHHEEAGRNRILVVVGTVNSKTKDQMEELWLSQPANSIFVDTHFLMKDEKAREEEIQRVVDEVLEGADDNMITTVTGDGIYPDNRIDFTPYMKEHNCTLDEATGVINNAFAEITYRVFKANKAYKGLYTSGGDVTVAVCERFHAPGLDLKDEVLPLAAYGRFMDGEFAGVHIVTKGGSQGNEDAINRCITYLKEKLYV